MLCVSHCAANGTPQKSDPVEKFWAWFKTNESRLKKFEEAPGTYLEEILAQAKKIQDGLAIELEPPRNNIIRMTISADGDRFLFPLVQNIISKAPAISGWEFIAFRQRMDAEVLKTLKMKAGALELSPSEMKFFPIVNNDSLDLIIYTDGVTDDNYLQVAYGGLLLLDNILGEYDCVMKVRTYDFHNMPVKKRGTGRSFTLAGTGQLC